MPISYDRPRGVRVKEGIEVHTWETDQQIMKRVRNLRQNQYLRRKAGKRLLLFKHTRSFFLSSITMKIIATCLLMGLVISARLDNSMTNRDRTLGTYGMAGYGDYGDSIQPIHPPPSHPPFPPPSPPPPSPRQPSRPWWTWPWSFWWRRWVVMNSRIVKFWFSRWNDYPGAAYIICIANLSTQ